MLLFVSHLAQQGLTQATRISDHLTSRLEMVMNGINKEKSVIAPCTRLPITIYIMAKIKEMLSLKPTDHDSIVTWAACALAFLGVVSSLCHHKKSTAQILTFVTARCIR